MSTEKEIEDLKKRINDLEPKESKTLEFWNSNLGLFILTTIFITFASFIWEQYSSFREETKAKSKRERILAIEANKRLRKVQNSDEVLYQYQYTDLLLSHLGAVPERIPVEYYNVKPAFVEFEGRTLLSILLELEDNTVNEKKLKKLRELIASIENYNDVIIELGQQWFDSTTHQGQRRFYKLNGDVKPVFIPIKRNIHAWLEPLPNE